MHLPHKEYPDSYEDDHRNPGDHSRQPGALAGLFGFNTDFMLTEDFNQFIVVRGIGEEGLITGSVFPFYLIADDGDLCYISLFDISQEVAEDDLLLLPLGGLNQVP